MKFLIITNHSYMLWQFRRELIDALLQRGEVVISTPFTGHELDFQASGCRCIETAFNRRGRNPFQEAGLFNFYFKLLKKEKPDLVITYSIKPNLYAGFLCRILKIPYYTNVQGLGTAFQSREMAAIVSVLYRAALQKARTVFFENKENAAQFIDHRIVSKEKILVLPGAGVNLKQFSMSPYASEKKGIRFLYLGRIMREKGVEELFSAFRRMKEEYGNRVIFDVVGFFDDDYQLVIDKLCHDGIIIFHGFQENPKPWYAAAHCVVLPSWHEGMSNVLLEAAASGRALIASDIPGCREAITEGENGFLSKAKNTDSLYNAMRSFLELSSESRAEMGIKARKKVEKEFDRSYVVDVVLRALKV